MPVLDLDQPCIELPPDTERFCNLKYIEFRSALICHEMSQAAYALDLQWMLNTCTELREFITNTFDPHFGCRSVEVLAILDVHADRLHRMISNQRQVS